MSEALNEALWHVLHAADQGESALQPTLEQSLAIVLRDTHAMVLAIAKQTQGGNA